MVVDAGDGDERADGTSIDGVDNESGATAVTDASQDETEEGVDDVARVEDSPGDEPRVDEDDASQIGGGESKEEAEGNVTPGAHVCTRASRDATVEFEVRNVRGTVVQLQEQLEALRVKCRAKGRRAGKIVRSWVWRQARFERNENAVAACAELREQLQRRELECDNLKRRCEMADEATRSAERQVDVWKSKVAVAAKRCDTLKGQLHTCYDALAYQTGASASFEREMTRPATFVESGTSDRRDGKTGALAREEKGASSCKTTADGRWLVHETGSWLYANDDTDTDWRLASDSATLEMLYSGLKVGDPGASVETKGADPQRIYHLEAQASFHNTECYQSNVKTHAVRALVRVVRRRHSRNGVAAHDSIAPAYAFLSRSLSASPSYSGLELVKVLRLLHHRPYPSALPWVDWRSLRVRSIVPHRNWTTHARYEERKAALFRSGKMVHEVLAFHGYSRAPLRSILDAGLMCERSSGDKLYFGPGIYGSADVRYSFMHYTANRSKIPTRQSGKVLLIRMLLGTVYDAPPGETLGPLAVAKLQQQRGIHSVCSCTTDKGNTPIYVVYDNAHADVLAAASRHTQHVTVGSGDGIVSVSLMSVSA
jgi:hypothetical protein